MSWAQERIVWIDGGESQIGTDRPEIKADGEAPSRKLRLKPYGIATTTVTNRDFATFIEMTGYKTDAEKIGWSYVFRGLMRNDKGMNHPDLPWWNAVQLAYWAQPFGAGSTWEDIESHPVVHISAHDAEAFGKWAGGRLPSEGEWEHAARGGTEPKRYPWGDSEPSNENAHLCNIWQGSFPTNNTEADGYYGTAPALSFQPNSFGLYNLSGNVWEWCSDRFRIRSISKAAKVRNTLATEEQERVLKGGSFLCHASYCWRYRIAARSGRAPDNATSNCGFRLAFDR